MTDTSIADLPLTAVRDAIVKRSVSSREATEACLARLLDAGARLNAIAAIDPDAALAAADAADADLASGTWRGPLHGVPLAHKDMFFRAGRVSACGSRILADTVQTETATVLDRLDAAGALDIAQLNMVEFALGTTGHNEVTGTPGNPWNPAHIPGGSSSGPAVAVAGRMAFGALGSDTGGSIRLPAADCGIVGLKPTYGRVSRHAALPLSFSLDTIGPMTRTVADAALMLQVLAGPDPADPTAEPAPVPDYAADIEGGIAGLRIGVPDSYFYDPLDAETRSLVDASLDVLRREGAEPVPVTVPPRIADTNALTLLLIAVEGATRHAGWLRDRPQDYGSQTRARLLAGLLYPAVDYIETLNLRATILAEFTDSVLDRVDVLHVPVLPCPVPTIAESDLAANPGFADYIARTGHCTRPFNFLGLPALSVPCGFTANGLPMAFQLVGRPFDEATLLRTARAYERATVWSTRQPELH